EAEEEEEGEDTDAANARRGRSGSGSGSRKRPLTAGKLLRAGEGGIGIGGAAAQVGGGRGGRGSGGGGGGGGATGAGASACCVKTVDMKGVPKEVKKTSKCDICKRKYGAMVPCAQAHTASERPCEKWMHPMCAAHVGRHCRILPPDEAKRTPHKSKYAVVCQDHTAVCLRQLASGHWVDFLSLYKLRTDLDRARVLFDCVLRREKVRR
ncbi:unnamed protein product, partial [Hapterophycus canaliculatus]